MPARATHYAAACRHARCAIVGITMHATAAFACIILPIFIKADGGAGMAVAGYPTDDMLFEEMAMQNPWWTGGAVPALEGAKA